MRTTLIAYGATALTFLVLDAIWLMSMVDRLYRPGIGHLMADRPNLAAAVPFYLLYVLGVVVFAVMPGIKAQDWTVALGLGALLGLFAYGTYDLTNLATLKGWSVSVSLIDMAWGAALTASAATGGMLAATWLSRGA
jgi:uncharacterized membrane protein